MVTFALFILLTAIVGEEFTYVVKPGDSFTSVGARFGVDSRVIAEANDLKPTTKLKLGQLLRIDNRHIVPESSGIEILINVPQRMLFYFRDDEVIRQHPIAVGKPNWRTPIGAFSILTMERDPVWDVPVSIQKEMRKQGKPVLTRVLPSPQNPLGKYWIGLSLPGVGIHGTNAPNSIYTSQTHGCIRLHPEDIEVVFPLVHVGTSGRAIYETVLMTEISGSVFLEVHPDIYMKRESPLKQVREKTRLGAFSAEVDWELVENVISKRDGVARDVTRRD